MRIFMSSNGAEIGLLRGLFESQGIECFTRNTQLSMATGSVPFLECQPELWISRDEDFVKAQEVLDSYKGNQQPNDDWVCPQCGDKNEGQFGACWKCDYLIDS